MDDKKPRAHVELIKAWADGAKIQNLTLKGYWVNVDIPTWESWKYYRIKPTKE